MKLLIAFLVWIQLFCFVIGDELELRGTEKNTNVLSRTRREEIEEFSEEQEYVELIKEEERILLRDPRAIMLKKSPADKMKNWRRVCWGVCRRKKDSKKYFKQCSTYKLKKTQKFCLKCRWGVKACKRSTLTLVHA